MIRNYGREDVDYETWYSDWMKRLALSHSKAELEKMLGKTQTSLEKSVKSHLSAIEATHSMTSNSGRRAKSRNSVAMDSETSGAIKGAIEIYELFPEKVKDVTYE